MTFTRYLQESSNVQLSLLQSSPKELGWHPSLLLNCQPFPPWQKGFTTQHSKAAWASRHACLYLHKAEGSGFSWLTWTPLSPFHPQGHLFEKASSSDAEAMLPTLTLPVSIFSWKERQPSQAHPPSPGNILCKAKYTILINPDGLFLGVATPAPCYFVEMFILASGLLPNHISSTVTCLLWISLFKSTSFQLKFRLSLSLDEWFDNGWSTD